MDGVDRRIDLAQRLRWMFVELLLEAPEEERPSTLLVFFQLVEGETAPEMAERFGCSRTTVWKRIRRVRRLWRAYDVA